MPRGFLVKRSKRAPSLSYRVRSIDDDCILDLSLTERGTYSQPFNSPDSGYGHSPCPQAVAPPDKEEATEEVTGSLESPSTLNIALSSSPVPGGSYPSSPALPLTRVPSTAPPALFGPSKRTANEMERQEVRKSTGNRPKKPKSARRITFDDDDSRSPVHGTIIKRLSDDENENEAGSPSESKPLGLGGDYMCKLCKEAYPDPFSLAQHKCSRIVHVEYRCPECDKVFNCPANLASHRRWHKPRPVARRQSSIDGIRSETRSASPPPKQQQQQQQQQYHRISNLLGGTNHADPKKNKKDAEAFYPCEQCNKKFRRPANLRKHLQQHGEEEVYPCHYCGKVFGSLISRTKHMFTHAIAGHRPSLEPSIVNCRICGLAFGDATALAQHERCRHQRHHHHRTVVEVEPKISPNLYPCKYCSTIFSDSLSLSDHIDKRHPTEHRRTLLLNVPVRS